MKRRQAFTMDLHSGAERQGVFLACARAALGRVGKMLNRLANCGAGDAARAWW